MGKENEKKTGPKKKEKAPYCQGKKKNLGESNKGSWFGQTPSTISASAEDPEHSNILGTSGLKIKVNVSAGCEQDSSSESGGSDEENETYPRELISANRVFIDTNRLSVDSLTSCFSAASVSFSTCNIFGTGFAFAFAFGVFAHYITLPS